MRILHVSDLHLPRRTGARDQPTLEDAWLGTDGTVRTGTLDFVVVSGDLTRSADAEEYDRVYAFTLSTLMPLLKPEHGKKRARVIFVPGNHDVSWARTDSFRLLSTASIDQGAAKYRDALRDVRANFGRSNWRTHTNDYGQTSLYEIVPDQYSLRYANYQHFVDSFYENAAIRRMRLTDNPGGDDWSAHIFPAARLAFYGFNSTWNNDRFWHGAEIDPRSIAAAAAHAAVHANGMQRIAVWHHGIASDDYRPDYLRLFNVGQIAAAGFQIAFHGHTHNAALRLYDRMFNARLTVISTGSLCAEPAARPGSVGKQFSLIRFEPPHVQVDVYQRSDLSGKCSRVDRVPIRLGSEDDGGMAGDQVWGGHGRVLLARGGPARVKQPARTVPPDPCRSAPPSIRRYVPTGVRITPAARQGALMRDCYDLTAIGHDDFATFMELIASGGIDDDLVASFAVGTWSPDEFVAGTRYTMSYPLEIPSTAPNGTLCDQDSDAWGFVQVEMAVIPDTCTLPLGFVETCPELLGYSGCNEANPEGDHYTWLQRLCAPTDSFVFVPGEHADNDNDAACEDYDNDEYFSAYTGDRVFGSRVGDCDDADPADHPPDSVCGACESDTDCDDHSVCTPYEYCLDDGNCQGSLPISCDADEHCDDVLGCVSDVSESLAVLEPTRGDVWYIGENHSIRWTSVGLASDTDLCIRICHGAAHSGFGKGDACTDAACPGENDHAEAIAVYSDYVIADDYYVTINVYDGAPSVIGDYFFVRAPTLPLSVGCGGDYSSLQDAVDAASDGDSITVCTGEYSGSTTVDGKALTIVGDGEAFTYLTDAAGGTVLKVVGGAEVALEGLTLRDAAAGLFVSSSTARLSEVTIDNIAGAVPGLRASASIVTLDHVTISNGTESGGFGGGGLGASASSEITADNLAITGNIAGSTGGGLYATDSSVDLVNSLIVGNSSDLYGGGVTVTGKSALTMTGGEVTYNAAANGGGILVSQWSTASLDGVDIRFNGATTDRAGAFYIRADGGASDTSELTFSSCDFGTGVSENDPTDGQVQDTSLTDHFFEYTGSQSVICSVGTGTCS